MATKKYFTDESLSALVDQIKASDAASLASAKAYTDTKTSDVVTATVVDNKISSHNTSSTAHSDIRDLISALSTKVNNFLNVDDTTTDELSEVLELINNNKGTLESLTSSKVNVSDIVNNLTTANTSKVLSANQGVVLKGLIDSLQEAVDGKADSTHTHPNATTSADGFMSATDKEKLDGIDVDNLVTLDGNQTITGVKTFNNIHTGYIEMNSNGGCIEHDGECLNINDSNNIYLNVYNNDGDSYIDIYSNEIQYQSPSHKFEGNATFNGNATFEGNATFNGNVDFTEATVTGLTDFEEITSSEISALFA